MMTTILLAVLAATISVGGWIAVTLFDDIREYKDLTALLIIPVDRETDQ
jgi:hypothetical protein